MMKFCVIAATMAFLLTTSPFMQAQQPTTKKASAMSQQVQKLLDAYQKELARLETAQNLAQWAAANTGRPEDYAATAKNDLALSNLHSDKETYRRIKLLRRGATDLDLITARVLEVAELAYARQQLPPEDLRQMIELSSGIRRSMSTWRGEIDGQVRSNNELLAVLRDENDSRKRQQAWETLKKVGGEVAPDVIRLAKVRNAAAKKLGFDNYWQMRIHFQEHDAQQLVATFEQLARLTQEPFTAAKRQIDVDLARRFGVKPEELMPWHYDNPFFQAAPPTSKINFNEFYKDKTKEEIVECAKRFFRDIDLPVDDILEKSSLYERQGKDQHAFCTNVNRRGDVRILCNVRPTAEWMQVTLHELGHAIYSKKVDPKLPFNIRCCAHTLTTEGVAMMFGALAQDPEWLIAYAGADPKRVAQLRPQMREQWRTDQLIFVRWTLVMFNFEKALYENPDQDLNTLWWDLVERYQQLRRPAGKANPDWAAKPHFTIAPVYYHNYMLGELFAAQLRNRLARLDGEAQPGTNVNFKGRKDYGKFLDEKTFHPGRQWQWPEYVERVTGEKLTPKCFAAEVKGSSSKVQ